MQGTRRKFPGVWFTLAAGFSLIAIACGSSDDPGANGNGNGNGDDNGNGDENGNENGNAEGAPLEVSGYVKAAEPVAEAEVELSLGEESYETTADADGRFQIAIPASDREGLASGDYAVIRALGESAEEPALDVVLVSHVGARRARLRAMRRIFSKAPMAPAPAPTKRGSAIRTTYTPLSSMIGGMTAERG